MIMANSLYVVVAFILHGRKVATLKVPTAPVADPLLAD